MKILLAFLVLILSSCGTKPVKVEVAQPEYLDENGESIDIAGLRAHLNMDRANEDLGYSEKSFFTCSVGYGFSGSQHCRPQYLIVLNFRIQCRDSEGTVSSVTNEELTAVNSDHLRWNVGQTQGYTRTDREGFGQLVTLAPTSMKEKKLRLTNNNDFLLMTAKEVRRIIVPRPWCAQETRDAAN